MSRSNSGRGMLSSLGHRVLYSPRAPAVSAGLAEIAGAFLSFAQKLLTCLAFNDGLLKSTRYPRNCVVVLNRGIEQRQDVAGVNEDRRLQCFAVP